MSSSPRAHTVRSSEATPATGARRAAAGLSIALLLVAGCGTGSSTATGSAAPAVSETLPPSYGTHAAAGVLHRSPALVQSTPASAVELRSTLERLLGEHVLVADEFVRAQLLGQEGQATAAADTVARNKQELVELVRSLGDAPVAQEFESAWQNHVDVLATYAAALRGDDQAGQQAARRSYVDAERRLAEAFSTVTGGRVPLSALTAAATMHGEHLLDQADAFDVADYGRAYAIQREAFAHMIAVADALSRGVAGAPGLSTAELDAPRRQLQSALSRLLAEHMGLMVQVMRAAHDGSPDFAAAGQSVNANTADLAAALRTLYGEDASRQFLAIWAEHVEALIDYARAADDEAARERARAAGAVYAPKLARFLAGATEQRLPAIELAAALTEHDEQLRDQVDAYAAGDLASAQASATRGYAHMFQLAQTLATAIGDTVASRLPKGGPATGGGGTAHGH